MKALITSFTLLLALLLGSGSAFAHPGHYSVEHVTSFTDGGAKYNVWNTHRRGLFGTELIEIRDQYGRLHASWWASPGWCFTEHAYTNHGCYSERGYLKLFKSRMKSYDNRANSYGGYSGKNTDPGEFCDHYSQLEYTVSGDTSGVCGHKDGLPLPAWAQ